MSKVLEKVKGKAKNLLGWLSWLLIVFLVVSTVKNIGRVFAINKAVQLEKDRVVKMRQENANLEAQIAETQGSAFIDRQIRNKLGLAKSGEAIVVLPDAEILKKLAPQVLVEKDTLPDPNWKKWLKLFTP